jgi:GntR family transcriptional regulator/MocR family aminotransferase
MGSVTVQIDHEAKIPVKTQIAEAYAAAIRSGALKPGSALPSIRALSSRLKVSPATVVAAYRELQDRGLALAEPRSAFRVSGITADSILEGNASGSQILNGGSTVDGAYAPELGSGHGLYALNRIEPDLRVHPAREFARVIAEVASRDPFSGGYEEYRGNAALREAIAAYDRAKGIDSDPVNGMLMTSGAQQALQLLARSFPAGTAVAFEDPCYPGARLAFSGNLARLVPVDSGSDGPEEASLAAVSGPGAVAAFYCCPTYGNPSGRSWSRAARLRVLEAAAKGGFLVIEDDYLGDLDYLDERPDRLSTLAASVPGAKVVRIRTFSKCLLPALRLASVTGEASLVSRLLALKVADDIGCSAFTQRALARFIASGQYEAHLERVRPRYRSTREAVREALCEPIEGLAFDDPPSGLSLLARATGTLHPERFVSECAREGALVSPGGDYWRDGAKGEGYFRICFGSLAPEEAAPAIDTLRRAASAARNQAPVYSLI